MCKIPWEFSKLDGFVPKIKQPIFELLPYSPKNFIVNRIPGIPPHFPNIIIILVLSNTCLKSPADSMSVCSFGDFKWRYEKSFTMVGRFVGG